MAGGSSNTAGDGVLADSLPARWTPANARSRRRVGPTAAASDCGCDWNSSDRACTLVTSWRRAGDLSGWRAPPRASRPWLSRRHRVSGVVERHAARVPPARFLDLAEVVKHTISRSTPMRVVRTAPSTTRHSRTMGRRCRSPTGSSSRPPRPPRRPEEYSRDGLWEDHHGIELVALFVIALVLVHLEGRAVDVVGLARASASATPGRQHQEGRRARAHRRQVVDGIDDHVLAEPPRRRRQRHPPAAGQDHRKRGRAVEPSIRLEEIRKAIS